MNQQKLARVLEMIGSAHDGEVAAAARLAHNMLKENGMTWSDLVTKAFAAAGPSKAKAERRSTSSDLEEAKDIIEFLQNRGGLNEWEYGFIDDLYSRIQSRRIRRLTEKQMNKLKDIAIQCGWGSYDE